MAVSRFKTSTSLTRSKTWIMSGRKRASNDNPNISFDGPYTFQYFGTLMDPENFGLTQIDTESFLFTIEPGTVIDYLIVGGGGSGGRYGSPSDTRGGEGGEVKTGTYTTQSDTYTINVGGGGKGWTEMGPGKDSSAFGITAKGGRENVMTGVGADGTYVPMFARFSTDPYQSNIQGYFGADGGQGKTGGAVGYAGGKGGGGAGAAKENGNPNAYVGIVGTGSGGGGANGGGFANAVGQGGSGIVVLRYWTNLDFIYE